MTKLTYNRSQTFLLKQLDMHDDVEIFDSFTFDTGGSCMIDVYLLTEKEEGCAIISYENYISLVASWSSLLSAIEDGLDGNKDRYELIGDSLDKENIKKCAACSVHESSFHCLMCSKNFCEQCMAEASVCLDCYNESFE